jgi:hypothetical protein
MVPSRTLLILADLAVFPISPSILDVRSVAGATSVLSYARGINNGRPEGKLVLNKMKTRDTISRELRGGASTLGLSVASHIIRELQAYRDVAQQGTIHLYFESATTMTASYPKFSRNVRFWIAIDHEKPLMLLHRRIRQ